MCTHVFRQRTLDGRGVRAKAAFERLFPGVFAYVSRQRSLLATGVRTKLTFEGLLASVDTDVFRQIPFGSRSVRTQRALVRLLFKYPKRQKGRGETVSIMKRRVADKGGGSNWLIGL